MTQKKITYRFNKDVDIKTFVAHDYIVNADLAGVERLLAEIVELLRNPLASIRKWEEPRDSILIADHQKGIALARADIGLFSKLLAQADPLKREQIYLARFILNETYQQWERLYLPLAGSLHMQPTLRLTDRSDQGLSQAGIKVDDIREAVTSYGKTRLVILGEPGCGKTTTLQRLALDLAYQRLCDPLNTCLPVRADLYKYTGEQQPDEFLQTLWGLTGLAGTYGEAIAGDRICFLLDGVNQMPSADRSKRISRLKNWASEDLLQNHWAIFTCRTADYVTHLGLPEVHVNVLDNDQIQKYFVMRFGQQDAGRHWSAFEKRLRGGNDRFERLARNPFMLNLMTESIAEGKSFGASRAMLMQDLVERLLARELDAGRQPDSLTADRNGTCDFMIEALSRLAFAMQKRSEGTGIPRRLVEKIPLLDSGAARLTLKEVLSLAVAATLLEETELSDEQRTETGYAFYHHLLQEYFAAQRLLALFKARKNLSTYWRVAWRKIQFSPLPLPKGQPLPPPPVTGWEETVIFVAALAGVEANKFVQQVARHNLPLAGRCLAEIGAERQDVLVLAEATRLALMARQRAEKAHLRARIDAGLALGELGHPELRPQPFHYDGKDTWAILPPLQPVLAGEFIFGSDPGDKDAYDTEKTNQRQQYLPDYSMGRYPVTNAEFKFFIDAGGYHEPRWWSEAGWQWRNGGEQAHAAAIEDWLRTRQAINDFGVEKAANQFNWAPGNRQFWLEVTALDEEAARQRARQLFERPFDRPAYWDDPVLASPGRPVVAVNWHEAEAYCNWLTAISKLAFRLPHELEWEKAARGTDGRVYPWGKEFLSQHCNTVESQVYRITPVGLYPGGGSPYGIWEASGNVREWTNSWYQAYSGSQAQSDDFGEAYRVTRGGSWDDVRRLARCANRNRYLPGDFFLDLGFRVILPGSDSAS